MQTFIVFGDPRRADKARTFTASIPTTSITVDDGFATIQHSGRTVGGGILSYQSETEAGEQPAHLSVILSESLPDDELANQLVAEGWAVTTQAPRSVTVPFSVAATLFLDSPTGVHLFHTVLWSHHSLVPTQRYTTHTPGGATFPTRVLSMEAVPGDRPSLLLYASDRDVTTGPDGAPAGWIPLHGFLPPDEWADLVRVSNAVEAEVGYLLSTPVVTGVILHDIDQIRPSDIADVLPSDVAEELTTALADLGREDLLPQDE